MKLRYRKKIKPVTISISVGDVDCADLDLLRRNFRASDILPLMGKNDGRMRIWLERNDRRELAIAFEKVVSKYEKYNLPAFKYKDNLDLFNTIYLDLLKVFFVDEFIECSINSLFDVLMVWSGKYSLSDTNLVCLLNFLYADYEKFKLFYSKFPTKLITGYFFDCCVQNRIYEGCISLYWEILIKHPDWVDCERIFDIASHLYYRDGKSEYLFLISKLLIENFPEKENLRVGVSCLEKALEQNNEDAIKYLVSGELQNEYVYQSYSICKVYFERCPSKNSFDNYFEICVRETRKSWKSENYKLCVNLANNYPEWVDDDKMFEISSDMFWMSRNPHSLFVVARQLIEKHPEYCETGIDCMIYAAKQLKYEPAIVYLQKSAEVANRY